MSQSSLGAMVACDGRSLAGPTHLSAVCERRSTDRSRSTAWMFTRMLQQARRTPEQFIELAAELFRVMAAGGRVGFEAVAWFNGGLFDDGAALPLEAADIETVMAASDLDWSEIDPSILGTLFERGLDPGKRPPVSRFTASSSRVGQGRSRCRRRPGVVGPGRDGAPRHLRVCTLP